MCFAAAQKPKIKVKPPPKPAKPAWKHLAKSEGASTSGTNSDYSEDEKVKQISKEVNAEKNNNESLNVVNDNDNVKEISSSLDNAMVKQESLDKEGMGNINSDGSVDSWIADDDSESSGKARSWVNDTMNEISKRLDGESQDSVTQPPKPRVRSKPKINQFEKFKDRESPQEKLKEAETKPEKPNSTDSPTEIINHEGRVPEIDSRNEKPKDSPVVKPRNTPPPRPTQPPNRNTKSHSPKGQTNIPNNTKSPDHLQGDNQSSSPKVSEKTPSGVSKVGGSSSRSPQLSQKGQNTLNSNSRSNSPKSLDNSPSHSPKRVRKKPTVPPPKVPTKDTSSNVTNSDQSENSVNRCNDETDETEKRKSAKPVVAPKPKRRSLNAQSTSPEGADNKVSPKISPHGSHENLSEKSDLSKSQVETNEKKKIVTNGGDNKINENDKKTKCEGMDTIESSVVTPQGSMPVVPVRKKKKSSKLHTDNSIDKEDKSKDVSLDRNIHQIDKTDNVNCDIPGLNSVFPKQKPDHIYEELPDKNNKRTSNASDKIVGNAPLSPSGIPHSQSLPRGCGDMSPYSLAEGDPSKFGARNRKSSNKEDNIYEEITNKSKGNNITGPTRSASHSAADNVKKPHKSEKEKSTGIFKIFKGRNKVKRERHKTDPGIPSFKSGKTQFFVQIEHTHLNSSKGSEESIAKDSGLASDTEGNLANLEVTDESNASTSTTDSIPELPEKEQIQERKRSRNMDDHVYQNVESGRVIYGDIEIKKNQAGRNDLITDSSKSNTLLSMSQVDADDEGDDFSDFSDEEEANKVNK